MKMHLVGHLTYKGIAKTVLVIGVHLFMICIVAYGLTKEKQNYTASIKKSMESDSIASVTAFGQVYSVLMSPRCMNCHPAGDIPLQGEDSHPHTMSPQRGIEGKGVYAMRCTNCHQETNSPGIHSPPGVPDWHMPPPNMKMVFQGRTAHQLAKQLIDPKQNGNKDIQMLIEHADDGLVLAGWNPGEGRQVPPISHGEFKKAWITWLTTGAYAPEEK
ncbi:hypothetical protein LZF95_06280 [Algoriphagus sp. AGSA1]|uniref:hypothetical protein n=1 Tax=Algoriphagus sp. AGSA1 TaxID=2907213 RepID=UPI001F31EC31|nr:hypothetical protein [Algoriphagus sp. AGSA1]MCE7054275.1 hypothetical protein [Algoriphagus sp. AGSA1]